MLQIGRNLRDAFTGFLRGKRFLVMDRDGTVSLGVSRAPGTNGYPTGADSTEFTELQCALGTLPRFIQTRGR